MTTFKEFLINREILANLKKAYGIDLRDTVTNDLINTIIVRLTQFDSEVGSKKEETYEKHYNLDRIAQLYEELVPQAQRKTKGEFFTPIQIVDYILKSVEYTETHDIELKKLIDLSCGSGSFIIRAVDVLANRLIRLTQPKEGLTLTSNQAGNIIAQVKQNIYGIDVNPIACLLCQINIYFTLFRFFKIIIRADKDYEIPIFNISNNDALQLNFKHKFDYVVGNPPYLFIRSIPKDYKMVIEQLSFETNKGQYDLYQLFIEIGIKNLNENGKLGYIVPDSLLALSNRKLLRKFIFNNTKIIKICVVGSGFKDSVVSNVIIILQKEAIEEQRITNQILIKKALNDQREYFQKQSNITKWDYKFLIHLAQQDIEILEHLNSNFKSLTDLISDSQFEISISRGVEMGKEGDVIYCDSCNRYCPLPKENFICLKCGSTLNSNATEKIVVRTIPKGLENAYKPFIYTLNRYSIKEYRHLKVNLEGINYKDLRLYNNRIVIRQLNQENLICAAYEKSALSSQSIYNIKINKSPIPEFNNFYLLGLINSRLLSYYFLKTFGSYKSLFPRILIEKLKTLPIKVPSTKKERGWSGNIREKVNQILHSKTHNEAQVLRLQNQIDLLVNDLYQINGDDYLHIFNSLNKLN